MWLHVMEASLWDTASMIVNEQHYAYHQDGNVEFGESDRIGDVEVQVNLIVNAADERCEDECTINV